MRTTAPNEPNPKFVIAVDFDGTCVTAAPFPEVGEEVGATPWLRVWNGHPDIQIVLWTCRGGGPSLQAAEDWFASRGINLAGVNVLESQKEWMADMGPKLFAHVYIDDRAIGFPRVPLPTMLPTDPVVEVPDWTAIGPAVTREFIRWLQAREAQMREAFGADSAILLPGAPEGLTH